MSTATVSTIFCVQQASGTDAAVNEALGQLPPTILPAQLAGISILDFLRTLPGVIGAIDTARSDPDDLYITSGTASGRDGAIYPGPGRNITMQAGQSIAPALAIEFGTSQNLSLWDYDSASDDDLLGSVTMYESERGLGEIIKLASSRVENSAYYVAYRVD